MPRSLVLNVITEEYEAARRVLVALQEVMSEEHALVHLQ